MPFQPVFIDGLGGFTANVDVCAVLVELYAPSEFWYAIQWLPAVVIRIHPVLFGPPAIR